MLQSTFIRLCHVSTSKEIIVFLHPLFRQDGKQTCSHNKKTFSNHYKEHGIIKIVRKYNIDNIIVS